MQTTSMKNNTEVKGFILLGLTNNPELQVPLFIVFMLIYLISLIGNVRMIMLIVLNSRLHTPMYFFLSNLSLVDFCYSSTVTPKVMAGLLMGDKVISYNACAAQMFFFALFGTVDSYLLAAMAYDRYAAVCKPLHYTSTMTTSVCARLAIGSYVFAFLAAVFDIGDTFSLSFCMSNVVHHFFCDIPAVMTLTCSDKDTNELILVLVSSFTIFFAVLVILISYIFIFITVLKIQSGEGYQKALSTCASHLVVPSSSHSMDTDKITSVFYTMVIPMLNPVVYSLRNKEVKNAIKKVVEKTKYSLVFSLDLLHK
uniref:Olfactory receptor n=1 Tax=Suricata suricatta TaxID=37032 RepID=A0A673TWI4_SURSU